MVDLEATVKLDYDDGFREGFLHGLMAGYMGNSGSCGCEVGDE